MNVDKLQKLQSQVRIGGKGTPRRKVKKHVKASGDDKKVDGALKKLHCQQIPAIEEVNMFKADGRVLHFNNPKVEASIGSNLFVIRGHVQDKDMGELVPGILPQLGHENLQMLRKLAEAYESASKGKGPAAAGADDDVPDLVENFDEAANGQVE